MFFSNYSAVGACQGFRPQTRLEWH